MFSVWLVPNTGVNWRVPQQFFYKTAFWKKQDYDAFLLPIQKSLICVSFRHYWLHSSQESQNVIFSTLLPSALSSSPPSASLLLLSSRLHSHTLTRSPSAFSFSSQKQQPRIPDQIKDFAFSNFNKDPLFFSKNPQTSKDFKKIHWTFGETPLDQDRLKTQTESS